MTDKIFFGKTFILVTGASQGIGSKIAEVLASSLEENSQILLLARNLENLKKTASKLPKTVNVNFESIDLSQATARDLKEIISKSLGSEGTDQFSEAVIVHNAGSIGDVSQSTIEMINLETLRKYYDLNVLSPAVLNGVFMEFFDSKKIKKHVINISSLCALKPIKSLGYYCSGKAAREMFFKVFAEENSEVNVLNYAPGPVQTDMLVYVCNNIGDKGTKINFQEQSKTALTPDETVRKLVKVLSKRGYTSGDHVDYYDEL